VEIGKWFKVCAQGTSLKEGSQKGAPSVKEFENLVEIRRDRCCVKIPRRFLSSKKPFER